MSEAITKDETPALTHPRRRAFLAAYAKTGNLWQASLASGVARRRHYDWLKEPAYAAAFQLAKEEAGDTLEAEAIRRARDGVDEPVFGKLPGKDTGSGQIGVVRKYSDNLLAILLKAHKPETYSEKVQHQHSGSVEARVSFYLPDNFRDKPPSDAIEGQVTAGDNAK